MEIGITKLLKYVIMRRCPIYLPWMGKKLFLSSITNSFGYIIERG